MLGHYATFLPQVDYEVDARLDQQSGKSRLRKQSIDTSRKVVGR